MGTTARGLGCVLGAGALLTALVLFASDSSGRAPVYDRIGGGPSSAHWDPAAPNLGSPVGIIEQSAHVSWAGRAVSSASGREGAWGRWAGALLQAIPAAAIARLVVTSSLPFHHASAPVRFLLLTCPARGPPSRR